MELSKTKTSQLSSLSSKKMRDKYGLFIAEGNKCVADMLGAFPLDCIVATEEWQECHKDIVENIGEKILTASTDIIRKISSMVTPPEVLAAFKIPDDRGPEFQSLDRRKLYLLLDGIQDPGNLGTIIRTADWFGIDTIFASKNTVDLFNPKVVQSTMGSLHRVKVFYCDLSHLILECGDMPVYGTLLDGENIFSSSLENHGFLIMGNEGQGISDRVRMLIDRPLLIPPYCSEKHAESLNVAIATAIALSMFRRQEIF